VFRGLLFISSLALPFCLSLFFLLFPMKKKQKIPAVQIISAAAAVHCAKSSELAPWNITHILLSLVLEGDVQWESIRQSF